ncbi:TonB-dependent receptor [Pedobacter sp. FW305-3-2-15-E-R2A2]|uniref:TonB-dependent receptor domain-containing protein n=1 Tax=Pedobacter sp. FW305-3-2-15-E-R2A2 TaxID=3140251 RepID=UPI003140C435
MKRIIFFLLLTLPLWANAQIKIKGQVKNSIAPLAWANVILTNAEGKLVKGTLTKDDGTFELDAKNGAYNIKVSYLGLGDWSVNLILEKELDLGTILLKENTGNLEGVVVVARKKLISYKADRLIFDVESSIAAEGGDGISAISAAPGVLVQNNAISMLGKGSSRVMLDGRMVELSGDDLISFLKSISAKDIKQVEVIGNPPAKYEAGGEGGLINIILKKGARDSWKNSTSLSYDQNSYGLATLRNNYVYHKDKVRFSLSGGGTFGNSKVLQELNTGYPSGLWELKYNGKQKENKVSGRLAFDYDLSARTSIGVQYLGNYQTPDSKDFVGIKIHNRNGQVDSLLINQGDRKLSSGNHTYNVHLVSRLDTSDRKISADLDYFTYNSKIDNRFMANVFSPDMTFLNTNQAARNVSGRTIDNLSAKVDMEHPLKFMNLSYGAKISFIKSKGDIRYFNTISGTPVLDGGRSNEFLYEENNQAVYVNGTKDFGPKLSIQFGLRLENTATEGESETLNQTNKNSYLELFPTFYGAYKPNDSHRFLFNYGRRINRPDFGVLNPFRSYINSNSYSEGNPFLKPSFGDNFDFSHVYKGVWRTNVFLNMTTDGYGPVFSSNPETNTLVLTRENYYKEQYFGLGENYSLQLTSWWQSENSVYLLGSKSKFTSQIKASPKNTVQLYLSTNHTFSLRESTKLQVDYSYSSSFKRGLYEFGAMSGLNIGLRQTFVKNNLQVSMLVNDVFNRNYLKNYTSIVNGIRQVYSENNSSRFFRISLAYNFGNDKVTIKERSFGNDEERKRTN